MKGLSALGSLMLAACLGLSGCGITYVSPVITDDPSDGVTVVPISLQSLSVANGTPYAPKQLPAAFSTTAGAGSPQGSGVAIPAPPQVPDLVPGRLELRPPPSAEAQPYAIGVGDVVQLATRGAPPTATVTSPDVEGAVSGSEVRQTYTVRDDGSIALPQVGAVMIGGMTIDDAEQTLFQRFVEAGLNPDFTLEIAGFNSKSITVGGDVGQAATVPVTLNVPTLDQALTAAGGIKASTPEYASIRIYRDGTLYQIPVENYNSDGSLRDLRLAAGDSIFVDTSYDLDRALQYYSQQINVATLRRSERSAALSELQAEIQLRRGALEESRSVFQARTALDAEDRDYVYLAGEVTSQSRYPLPYGRMASLADALYDSGGFRTETGNPSQIYVLRLNTDTLAAEPVTAWHLDARNAGNLTLATRFELRPDDIIFVEEQPITRWNRAFQQFFPTLLSTASDVASN